MKKKKTAAKAAPHKEHDITALMIKDHKPLKRLIKIMKEPETPIAKLRNAFEEFAPLLEAHAKPEEAALYERMKKEEEADIRIEAFEGSSEHALADELANKIRAIRNEDDWKANVKVLAELVEHHIEEEEEEMIPDLKKDYELEVRIQIGEDYLARRASFEMEAEEAA